MRTAFSILLLLAVCLHTGGRAVMYSWYFLGNSSFEQLFCKNIEQPELECHGKCHLTEMEKSEPVQDQNQPVKNFDEERISNYIFPEDLSMISAVEQISPFSRISFHHLNPESRRFVQGVFHPPR